MSETSLAKLARQRAAVIALRARLRGSVAALRADAAPRVLGHRLKDAAQAEGSTLAKQAGAVALANKPVIALTGAALALWFARHWLGARIGAARDRNVAISDSDE